MKNTHQLLVWALLISPLFAFGQLTVAGTINTPQENPVCDVLVTLLDDAGQTVDQEITDDTGTFTFADVPANSAYSLRLEKEANAINGTSTFDLVLIARGILGIDPLDPYQLWAADVNNSGSVTALDMVFIRQIILSITTEFIVPPWLFGFPDAPGGSDMINLGEVTGNLNLDIIGVKTGDMNYTAVVCN